MLNQREKDKCKSARANYQITQGQNKFGQTGLKYTQESLEKINVKSNLIKNKKVFEPEQRHIL